MNSVLLSVVVCTYNREKYLVTTLDHLKNQTADNDIYEILIINNNSPDNTEKISLNFKNNNPAIICKYFLEKKQGLSYARNKGIQEAKGKYIAFIDDDAFAKNNYVEEIVNFFNDSDIAAIGGRIYPQYESGYPPAWMNRFLWPLVAALDMGDKVKPFKKKKYPLGANMAFKKEVFDKYGYFNPNLGRKGSGMEAGEEKDIFYRLQNNNEHIFYLPNAEVNHIIPLQRTTESYIKRQCIGVGKSEKRRIYDKGAYGYIEKAQDEVIKIGATILISLFYLLKFDFAKAKMLISVRYWIVKGLIT